METIKNAVQDFFDRYPQALTLGKKTTLDEFDALPKKIKRAIPIWYKELLLQFPIANLPLGIPNDFGQKLLQGRSAAQLPLMEIIFYSVQEIGTNPNSFFPHSLLFKKKIIGIAEDKGNTGEGIFIDGRQENPPVFMIFHDMGDSIKELMHYGERLLDHFSDLFTFGKIANKRIRLNDKNREPGRKLILEFFEFVDAEIQLKETLTKNDLPLQRRLVEGLTMRNITIEKGEYIMALLHCEWGLCDSGFPLTKKYLDFLTRIYEICGLHIPELTYVEELVRTSEG